MATFELVEKLREKANVTYDEAKAALDACGDDLLEAMIMLEKEGKVKSPQGGGYYSSKGERISEEEYYKYGYNQDKQKTGSTADNFGKFFRFLGQLIHKANTNMLEVKRRGSMVIALPVSVLILFLILAFWVTIPVMILGLFMGCRYSFRGIESESTNINSAMNAASDAAETLKDEIISGFAGKK